MGSEKKGCPATAVAWAPGPACFRDAEATQAPPVVDCVVQRPCACCGGCIFFMFLTLLMAMGAVSSQTEDFPTTDSSGFRDRSDFTSLAMDAATLIRQAKEKQEGDNTEGMICTEGRDGTTECILDTVMPVQSQTMRRWSLILMFKRENGATIFEPEILRKIRALVDNVLNAPGYPDFCLRKAPVVKTISSVDTTGGAITISPADDALGLEEGTEMILSDHSGTSGPAITDATVAEIAGLDVSDENTITLDEVESRTRQSSPTEQIAVGQTLQLTSKVGRTCAAQPLDQDLVVAAVTGNTLTFETPVRVSDPDAQNNCVITRAAPCALLPLGTPMLVTDTSSTASTSTTTITFDADITFETHATADPALSNCDLTATKGACESINSPLNWIFPSEMSVADSTYLVYDGQGSSNPTCVANHALLDNECRTPGACPCTSMACVCDPSSADASALDKLDASLSIMAQSPWSLYMVGKEFSQTNRKSDVFQLTIGFGGPLCRTEAQGPIPGREGKPTKRERYCYENTEDDADAQTQLFEDWAIENVKKDLDDGELTNDLLDHGVEVLYFFPVIAFQEILNVLMHDGMLAIGSVAFVFLYMYFHSSSAFIAAAGMLHIVMSFPFAFCIYRYVFGIVPVYALSFLSIYVILAIGADDVFVFIDAWRQSARAGDEVNSNILTRMTYAYKRAAKAMLITSTTTFGAFVATATSPLGEVACFGIFTALLVLANYIFVITYFPAVLIIYHKRFENTSGCCCYVGARKIPPAAPYRPQGTAPPPVPTTDKLTNPEDSKGTAAEQQPEPEPQKIERCCTDTFAPIVATPARFAFLAATTIFAVIMITQAIHLGPTTKEDQLLPDWHKFQKIINMFTHDFAQGESTPMKYNTVIWGVDNEEPVDRSGVSRFDAEGMGTLNLDSTFDLSATASQEYLVEVCNALVSATTTVDGNDVPLVRQDGGLGNKEVNCFIWGFQDWLSELGEDFPVEPANFGPLLNQWIAEMKKQENSKSNPRKFLPHEDYQDMLWMEGDSVKVAMIQVNTTIGRWVTNHSLSNYQVEKICPSFIC